MTATGSMKQPISRTNAAMSSSITMALPEETFISHSWNLTPKPSNREYVCKHGGCRVQGQHLAGTLSRAEENLLDLCEVQLLVAHHADEQTVDAGDSAGFGRGAEARSDADDDDERHQQCPEALAEGADNSLEVELSAVVDVVLLRVEVADHHQDKADGKAGGVTGKEHTGDGKAGDGREDYHNVAGRDDRRGGRGARDHCAGELFLVADLLHIGRGDGADSRDSRGAGAGNSSRRSC